ncbi:hypothetical protein Droror1_Dr00020665, partial [Drosera rotundifolia]
SAASSRSPPNCDLPLFTSPPPSFPFPPKSPPTATAGNPLPTDDHHFLRRPYHSHLPRCTSHHRTQSSPHYQSSPHIPPSLHIPTGQESGERSCEELRRNPAREKGSIPQPLHKHTHRSASVIEICPKACQISKVAEIHGLGLYCDVLHGCHDAEASEKLLHTWTKAIKAVKNDFIVAPFDASFLVVKSRKLEHDSPQYTVMAESGKLELFIDAAQLQHMLALSDYISVCRLREKE